MRRSLSQGVAATAFVIACLSISPAVAATTGGVKPGKVTISVGNPGTPWSIVGACIAQMMADQGVRAGTELGAGLSNVVTVSNDKTNYGFTMAANLPLAWRGARPYPKPIRNTRGVAATALNATHVAVLADSGITTFRDLKGKAFATQPVGNTSTYAFALLLETVGLGESDLQLSRGGQNFGSQALRDRKVVGYTATTGYPAASFSEASQAISLRFLSIPDEQLAKVQERNDGFVRHVIAAGTYNGQTEAIQTMATTSMLITNVSQPDDEVYWLTRHLAGAIDRLHRCHGSTRYMTPAWMAKTPAIEMHPGAARYYREAGLLP